jgi:hypothetical protein
MDIIGIMFSSLLTLGIGFLYGLYQGYETARREMVHEQEEAIRCAARIARKREAKRKRKAGET